MAEQPRFMEDMQPQRPRGRAGEIEGIVGFVERHPESYASLAVCRRSLDGGLPRIDPEIIGRLKAHLQAAPDEEIAAYWDIVR